MHPLELGSVVIDGLQRLLTGSVQSLDGEHIQGSIPGCQSKEELLMGSDPRSWRKLVMIVTDLEIQEN